MIDTVKLISPRLRPDLLDYIRRKMCFGGSYECDGHPKREWTADELQGSYDHRTHFKIDESSGSISLEGSVHKAIEGHNVLGGPEDLSAACRWYVHLLGCHLGVELPDGGEWLLRRVDVAEAFALGSPEQVAAFVDVMARASFGRRKGEHHARESVTWRAERTRLKLYHKGPEFRKHDASRLAAAWLTDAERGISGLVGNGSSCPEVLDSLEMSGVGDLLAGALSQSGLANLDLESKSVVSEVVNGAVASVAALADLLIRVEVEFRRRYVADTFGKDCAVHFVDQEILARDYDREVEAVMKETRSELEKVGKSEDVSARLQQLHGVRLGSLLHGTYLRIAAHGEKRAREMMNRRTYYHHRSLLLDAGCDWTQSDVRLVDIGIPSDFSLKRDSPYRVSGSESLPVLLALAPFRDRVA